MTRFLIFISILVSTCVVFSKCNSGAPGNTGFSSDSLDIAAGEKLFNQSCSGCHNFRQDGIGPNLRSVTTKTSHDWLKHFIQSPEQMISSGDERAKSLFKKFSSIMPSFSSLSEKEIEHLLAYLHTFSGKAVKQAAKEKDEIENPFPDTIALSDLVVPIRTVLQMPASNDSTSKPRARITKMIPLPGSDDLVVLEMRGQLYRIHNNQSSVYFDLHAVKPKLVDRPGLGFGFGSFAFHPDFRTNGLLYTTHSESPESGKADFSFADTIRKTVQWVITEWKTTDPGAATFTGTSRELFRVNFVASMHGVQDLNFNYRAKKGTADYGMLYIGVGDGGSTESGYPSLSHDKNKIWGTVLRIDPLGNNSGNGKYGIPKDNPFADGSGLKEVYAYGFRNPHRIIWTASGKMLVFNIGQAHIESIDLVQPGQDFGWPIREGAFEVRHMDDLSRIFPLPANDSIHHITYPVASYDHGEGIGIAGGYEYLGSAAPTLKGKIVFGDINSGRLFYVNETDLIPGKLATIKEWKISLDGAVTSLPKLAGTKRVEFRLGIDGRNELYLMTKVDGKIYKVGN